MGINTIDEYMKTLSPESKDICEDLRKFIHSLVPEAEEVMAYRIPTFKLRGKNLVHFAVYEKHIGFYPTPSAIKQFKDKLKPYKHAKGSIQFPIDKPMPMDLIEEIVKFRIDEVLIK